MNAKGANILLAAMLSIVSLAAVAMAVPVMQDSLIAQGSLNSVYALREGEAVPGDVLRWAYGSTRPGQGQASGDRLQHQAILALALAGILSPRDPEYVTLLSTTKQASQERLQRAPRDTHAWARLAMAEYLLNGPNELSIEALGHSYQTGPLEYLALWPRLRLGALSWQLLPEELREATLAQAAWTLKAGRGAHGTLVFYQRLPADLQPVFLARLQGQGQWMEFLDALAREEQ